MGNDKTDAQSIQDAIQRAKDEIERQSTEWVGDAEGMVE